MQKITRKYLGNTPLSRAFYGNDKVFEAHPGGFPAYPVGNVAVPMTGVMGQIVEQFQDLLVSEQAQGLIETLNPIMDVIIS